MSESVKIAVRERPLKWDECADSEPVLFIPSTSNQIIIADGRPFSFDHIFTHEQTQAVVYSQLMQPLVCKLLEGYNATALAYGQTGTGKTYTMGLYVEDTDELNTGMLLRTIRDIFERLNDTKQPVEHEISISFIEIYNEKAYDLITNAPEPINVKGQKFAGGSRQRVYNVEEVKQIVLDGTKNRHVRPTKMNVSSSRSHAVFTVHASLKRGELRTQSSLHIVDLAGSEGIRRTGHQGLALTEGVNINQGLLSIGKVLQALSTGAKVIPYRDSFLTTVLQSSLNANSYLSLLACISPLAVDISESLSTLRFAQNAKTLRNNPQINSITAECMRTLAAKTPSKTGLPLRAKNTIATPAAKRRANETMTGLSTIKKPAPIHSNTFCTPNKLRKVDLFKHNATDLGYLSAGKKRQTAMPDLARNHVVAMDDLAELQFFNQDAPRDSIDSRSSILSLNVSNSTSIDVPPVQMSYSPLVKRCMAEFETTIDEKLKKMFENLQNMTMAPPPPVQAAPQQETVSSTAVPGWDTMKQELQSIVRAELTTIMAANAASEREDHAKSPLAPFKRPQSLPLTSTVRKDVSFSKRTSVVAPMNLSCLVEESILERTNFAAQPLTRLDDEMPAPVAVVRRQSTRLSKRFSRNVVPTSDRRRSCRISAKMAEKETTVPPPPVIKSAPRKTGMGVLLKNKVIAEYFHSNQSVVEQRGTVARVSKKAHKEAVLKLMNTGSIKELQILPTIGLKTAYQLITHRTLKGKFKSFDEISKLPVWRGKAWERFQEENHLV